MSSNDLGFSNTHDLVVICTQLYTSQGMSPPELSTQIAIAKKEYTTSIIETPENNPMKVMNCDL